MSKRKLVLKITLGQLRQLKKQNYLNKRGLKFLEEIEDEEDLK